MEIELLQLILESLSGVAVLALGFWFIIARMRNRAPDDPTEKYVTKKYFHDTVNEGRVLAEARHVAELQAIKEISKECQMAINQTNQNHLDHVQHGHD